MRVLLDEQFCDVSADSVDQAIAAAAAIAQEQGRIIVEVMVDGRQWMTDDSQSPSDTSNIVAESPTEVRLTSADPAELMNEIYTDASSALSDADQLQREAAELLQAGHTLEAMQKLGDAVSIWISVQQAVSMGAQLKGELNRPDIGAIPEQAIATAVEQLNGKLGEVRAALQRSDTVALADSLLYDLPDVVQQWRNLLKRQGDQ